MVTIVVVAVILLMFMLWAAVYLKPSPSGLGEYGTRFEDPNFEPIPRPPKTFIDPPRRNVEIRVRRNAQGVPIDLVIMPSDLRLEADQQVAWSGGRSLGNNGAKVEIRFSPATTPFGGASFFTARSGVSLSGKATRALTNNAPQKYTVLASTPDGFFLTKIATVTPTGERNEQQSRSTPGQITQTAPEGGYGERYEDPKFEPVDRPAGVEGSPSKQVRIRFVSRGTNEIDIIVDPEEVVIGPNEQVAWTTGPRLSENGGKSGIRFAANKTPFGGHTYISARGGTLFSGLPVSGAGTFEYNVVFTTPDGIFQLREKTARVRVIG
jgi:hypothetical protein